MAKKQTTRIEAITKEPAIDLALDTIKIGKQAFVFVGMKSSAEATAEKISKKLKEDACLEIAEKILGVLPKPTRQCERLARCVKKGVAFHHAGLHYKQRELIEENFRKGKIKIIACTPTLAAGVDLPAFRAIIKDLKRYTGEFGASWIPVLEYLQMSGRAGRPSFDSYGEAVCLASTKGEKKTLLDRYITGEPEEIYSKLAVEPVLRTYLLSLIATEFVNTKKDIFSFFEKTFWAFQFKDLKKLHNIILKMLNLLLEFKFIRMKNDEFASADELDNSRIEATLIGKRVAELYIDPLTANNLILGMARAISAGINDFALLQLVSNQLEIRPMLRVKNSDYDAVQERIMKSQLLVEEPPEFQPDYYDFVNSVKTAMFFEDWINEGDEEYLLEKYNIRPGETRAKLESADWLLYSAEVLASLMKFHRLVSEIIKMRIRVKNGVKEELIPLLKLKGVGRVRARKLFNAKIKNIADIKKTDIFALSQLIGKKLAKSVKEQVGQKINESDKLLKWKT